MSLTALPPLPSRSPALSALGLLTTRKQIVAATCACVGATAFLYAVDPNHHTVYPQCLLYQTTGIYCAGCGATRAAYALLHGHILEALHDNVLFVAALPLLVFVTGSHVLSAWRNNAWPRIMVEERTILRRGLGFLFLLFGFMVLRNLPGWPFVWLRP